MFIHALDELSLVGGVEPLAIVLGIHFGSALCTAGIKNSMQKQPCIDILQENNSSIIEKKMRKQQFEKSNSSNKAGRSTMSFSQPYSKLLQKKSYPYYLGTTLFTSSFWRINRSFNKAIKRSGDFTFTRGPKDKTLIRTSVSSSL